MNIKSKAEASLRETGGGGIFPAPSPHPDWRAILNVKTPALYRCSSDCADDTDHIESAKQHDGPHEAGYRQPLPALVRPGELLATVGWPGWGRSGVARGIAKAERGSAPRKGAIAPPVTAGRAGRTRKCPAPQICRVGARAALEIQAGPRRSARAGPLVAH